MLAPVDPDTQAKDAGEYSLKPIIPGRIKCTTDQHDLGQQRNLFLEKKVSVEKTKRSLAFRVAHLEPV